MLIVDSFGMRDAGRVKEVNEDFLAVFEPEEATEAEERGRMFIVADGMGNQGAGEDAAKIAVNAILSSYYSGESGDDTLDALRFAMEQAHEAIRKAAHENPEYQKMGATCTALVITDDKYFVAHVGDTRAFLVRRGEARQLTEDHNWAGEQLRLGKITKVHANTHPRRKNLTRSLGQTPEVEVDTQSDVIEPGDIFLLASDGLYDSLSDSEIEKVVTETSSEMACRELVARANRNGGSDNIAAIVVKTIYEGKPFIVKERKSNFKMPDFKLPFDVDSLRSIKFPTDFPFYMAMVALAALIIIGGSIFLFKGCGDEKTAKKNNIETPVSTGETGDNGDASGQIDRAKISIITVPEGAKIKVDGAPLGSSPVSVDLPHGDHEIEIEHEGYQIKRHKFTVKQGEQSIPLNFMLVPHPSERSPDMAFVDEGFFVIGRTGASAEESPPQKVYISAFYIDRAEVSNTEYKAFMDATGRKAPDAWEDPARNLPNLPVVGVDWADADAYCKWANKRLPTEAEWEKAARGKESYFYPWGNAFDSKKINIDGADDGFADVAPVDALPEGKSPFGCYNMVGNVAEWTASYFEPNYYSSMPIKNPRGPDTGNRRTIRGGSYKTPPKYATATYRSAFSPEARKLSIGFRCAKD